MSKHIQKFEACMFKYCSVQAERAYQLLEDSDAINGQVFLAHLADTLQFLVDASANGQFSINEFIKSIKDMSDVDKDSVYAHLQESGFGQYIPD